MLLELRTGGSGAAEAKRTFHLRRGPRPESGGRRAREGKERRGAGERRREAVGGQRERRSRGAEGEKERERRSGRERERHEGDTVCGRESESGMSSTRKRKSSGSEAEWRRGTRAGRQLTLDGVLSPSSTAGALKEDRTRTEVLDSGLTGYVDNATVQMLLIEAEGQREGQVNEDGLEVFAYMAKNFAQGRMPTAEIHERLLQLVKHRDTRPAQAAELVQLLGDLHGKYPLSKLDGDKGKVVVQALGWMPARPVGRRGGPDATAADKDAMAEDWRGFLGAVQEARGRARAGLPPRGVGMNHWADAHEAGVGVADMGDVPEALLSYIADVVLGDLDVRLAVFGTDHGHVGVLQRSQLRRLLASAGFVVGESGQAERERLVEALADLSSAPVATPAGVQARWAAQRLLAGIMRLYAGLGRAAQVGTAAGVSPLEVRDFEELKGNFLHALRTRVLYEHSGEAELEAMFSGPPCGSNDPEASLHVWALRKALAEHILTTEASKKERDGFEGAPGSAQRCCSLAAGSIPLKLGGEYWTAMVAAFARGILMCGPDDDRAHLARGLGPVVEQQAASQRSKKHLKHAELTRLRQLVAACQAYA